MFLFEIFSYVLAIRFVKKLLDSSHCFTKSVLELEQGEVYVYCMSFLVCQFVVLHWMCIIYLLVVWFVLIKNLCLGEERRVEGEKSTIKFVCLPTSASYCTVNVLN